MVQRQVEADAEEELIQTKQDTGQPQTVSPVLANRIHSLKGGGQPLPKSVRDFFEPKFGVDFSKVRIHSGSQAAEMSQGIRAKAFTYGADMYFNQGQYNLESSEGKRLLGHELTHILQQGKISKNPPFVYTDIQREVIQRNTSQLVESCPQIDNEEIKKSKTEIGYLQDDVYFHKPGELLIADYGVNWGSPKKSAINNPFLIGMFKDFEDNQNYRISIIGCTDCSGENHRFLRERRAKKIERLLGPSARSRITYSGIKPLGQYFYDNSSPLNRAKNRSVVIKFLKNIDFEPEEIKGDKEKGFTCGPDITKPLTKVMNDTEKLFNGWTSDQKDEACDELKSYTTGGIAWDIVELHNNAWIHKNFQPDCATKGASPSCGSSVQVGDQCYYAGSVNYVIFGKMCKLCHDFYYKIRRFLTGVFDFDERAMLRLIELYKGPYGASDPFSSTPSKNYQKSREWAYVGYYGWPQTNYPKGDRNNCLPYCSKLVDRNFTIHWNPHQSLEKRG